MGDTAGGRLFGCEPQDGARQLLSKIIRLTHQLCGLSCRDYFAQQGLGLLKNAFSAAESCQ